MSSTTPTSQWLEVQEYFGLSQAALGRILGLSPPMMSQVATGRRSLPGSALPAWSQLVLAMGPAETDALPPLPAAEAYPLVLHAQTCVAAAARLAVALATAQARAAWATRRLAALPRLTAPLPASPPTWLVVFESEARLALTECGPLAQVRLAVRRAGLLHEAAAVGRLFRGAEINSLSDMAELTTFNQIFNHLPTLPLMAFSVSRFTTKAQCQAYLDKKAPERTLLAAHLGTVQAELATWDIAGNPATDLVSAQDFVTDLTTMLAATTNPREKLRTERLLNQYRTRVTNLTGRTITHGADELLDREQDRDEATSDLTILDALLLAVTNRRDALPA